MQYTENSLQVKTNGTLHTSANTYVVWGAWNSLGMDKTV